MVTGILIFILVGLPYAIWRHNRNTRDAREILQRRYDSGLIDPGVLSKLKDENPAFLRELETGKYRR